MALGIQRERAVYAEIRSGQMNVAEFDLAGRSEVDGETGAAGIATIAIPSVLVALGLPS